MKCHQRGFYLAIGCLNVLAVILMSVAVGTNRWTEADVIRKIAIARQNATSDASFVAGFKYIGLFRGCEEKKYAVYFEPRSRCFTALEEYGKIAKTELAYVSLISCCLCIGFHIITIYVSLYAELVRSASNLLQCVTPVMTMSITVLLASLSFGSYFYLYKNYLQTSLLNQSDRRDGFSTRGSSKLGFSFWLMITSTVLDVLTILMLAVGMLRRGKTTFSLGKGKAKESEPNSRPKDGPIMMMY